jgi:membrane protein
MQDSSRTGAPEPAESVAATGEGFVDHVRGTAVNATAKAKRAGESHVSIAVPFRAVEHNRRVAASVLAGGISYRIFLWLLPFGLIVGGVLGLGNAAGIEDAVAGGGIPGAVVNAIGYIATTAEANTWWLILTGVPLLLWEGYAGAKALQLMHALVWNDPPPRPRPLQSSLAFSGVVCAFIATVLITWWFRDASDITQVVVFAVMIAPLAGLWLGVSLRLPHGTASWKALLPGAVLVAVGFQVCHGLVVYLVAWKVEHVSSTYAALGSVTTLLFFMYIVARIVVTAPILNCSLHAELRGRQGKPEGAST